ncbi:MAG: hypothetical protein OXH13_03605 [Chloroflexi bacterium]|nr:hypothetical protein [Chloroflexota bacterium]MCY3696602.1 hypothetical protein [Chloroflexota bacterium]MXX31097.1 hypothetical protein [Chloroflexota bacterium]MXX81094.1 hypothetical protein [Chloroflexota bacterium]MYB21396.1 hypothetical protein [Chloroflexota bacterium]
MSADPLDRFSKRYPRLYHMAEAGSWTSVREHGLLSTTALLDLFEIDRPERREIETQWRPEGVPISHPIHGTAVIRDQWPMPPEHLANGLDDISPRQWYEFLNRRTFLWLAEQRLKRMLNAAPYRDAAHDVLTLDTRSFVGEYLERITVCPINSGFAMPMFGKVTKRSFESFQSIEQRASTGGLGGLAELTVEYAAPDAWRFVTSVESWRGKARQRIIWQR